MIERENCRPTICNRDTLMSEDDVFMTKQLVREECAKCLHQALCLQAIDLLDHNKLDEAEKLIE